MKFFFQLTRLNYKVRYAMAIRLKERFPDATFGALGGEAARDFIESRGEVLFDPFILQYKIADEAYRSGEIDHDLLNRFEEALPEKSLWRVIAADRQWGYQFCKGVFLPHTRVKEVNTRENILKVASGIIKFYDDYFKRNQPDVFIAANGQNSMSCAIIEETCRMNNVLYVLPEIIRTLNYAAISDNRQYTFPHIDHMTEKLIKREIEMDLSQGAKLYDQIVANFQNKDHYSYSSIAPYKSAVPWLLFIRRCLTRTVATIVDWNRQAAQRKDPNLIYKQPDRLKTFMGNLYSALRAQYRRMQLTDARFYKPYQPDEKYLYFPLHSPNEYSTQVQGTMWINQLMIIEALAKSVPYDWKVLVKEHPGTLIWRTRPSSFYREIKKYSNVDLIPTDTDSDTVIKNAQMVVTVVGTSGWEAILRGVPVIDFEDNIYHSLRDLYRRCTDIKELSNAIHEEYRRFHSFSKEERRRQIICFLAAIDQHAFWIDNPLKVSGDQSCTFEEAKVMGKVIADGLVEFMRIRELISKTEARGMGMSRCEGAGDVAHSC